MIEFLLWCIGIGLFLTYGLPVLMIGLAIGGGIVLFCIDAVTSIFKRKGGK
jgi:hypothetical protein